LEKKEEGKMNSRLEKWILDSITQNPTDGR